MTAGGVYELLRDVLALLPGLSEIELVESWTGLRPGTPDNAPIIGIGDDGIVYAAGHYRNGILTSPITAAAVAALVPGREPPIDLSPFSPGRFDDDPAEEEAGHGAVAPFNPSRFDDDPDYGLFGAECPGRGAKMIAPT